MKHYIYCMAIFAMMLYSCNKNSSKDVMDNQLADQTITENNNNQDKPKQEEQSANADTVSLSTPPANITASSTSNEDWDKKIIKTADLELQLDDYKKFNTSFHASLKQFGAYIANEKQQETDSKLENSVTIKVPVAQFDDFVNSISGDGIKIVQKNISGADVTGEFIDTKARLQAKLAVREKYLQLLKEAKNMKDIIATQNEINEIQENIEAANGRMNYLQHSAAYSTITINYYQFLNGSTDEEQPGFYTKLSDAFSTGAAFVSGLFLFLISIWPFILAVVIFWVYVKRFKIKKA